jgi:gelsolin
LDRKIKAAASQLEAAWEGMGQTTETRVWRIENFQIKAWPEEMYGMFHKGDSYIVLNTYKKGASDALSHDVHIWIGKESSQDEYGTAGAYPVVLLYSFAILYPNTRVFLHECMNACMHACIQSINQSINQSI